MIFMTRIRSKPRGRSTRADAQRNRERILQVAKEVFTRSGANTTLDDIAKQAGVGPGTLYRHFPARDALLEAVYRTEVEKLAAAERKFAETMPPLEALRAWMLLFVDYIATKKIIAPALNTLVGGSSKVIEASYTQVHEAIRALVRRAIKSGDRRKELDAVDLLKALVGVACMSTTPDSQQTARRLVDILISGSRPVKYIGDLTPESSANKKLRSLARLPHACPSFQTPAGERSLDGGAPSVDGELCAVNEAGAIRRQKDNGLGNFVRCRRTAGGSLSG